MSDLQYPTLTENILPVCSLCRQAVSWLRLAPHLFWTEFLHKRNFRRLSPRRDLAAVLKTSFSSDAYEFNKVLKQQYSSVQHDDAYHNKSSCSRICRCRLSRNHGTEWRLAGQFSPATRTVTKRQRLLCIPVPARTCSQTGVPQHAHMESSRKLNKITPHIVGLSPCSSKRGR